MVHVLRSYVDYKQAGAGAILLASHLALFRIMARLLLRRLPSGVKSRQSLFTRFLQNDFRSLLTESLNQQNSGTLRRPRSNVGRRVKRLISQNRIAAAAVALEETPIETPSLHAAQQLRSKFPARKMSLDDSAFTGPTVQLNVDLLKSVAAKMNKHAASGISGIPVWALTQPLTSHSPSPTDVEFSQLLCHYFQDVANGHVYTREGLSFGQLLALVKPDSTLRPVVMPEVDHRFIGRTLLHLCLDDVKTYFGDLQLSHAQAGTEKVAHFVRAFLEQHDDAFVIQLDLTNAFNEICRNKIRSVISERFPLLLRFFDLMYREQYNVVFGEHIIPCSEGVLQGDPLGPTYFSLGIHSILLSLQSQFPEFCLKYYSDDGNILCRKSHLAHPARISEFICSAARLFKEAGLAIRLDKSSIYSPHFSIDESLFNHDQLLRCSDLQGFSQIRLIAPEAGIIVLGSPVGSVEFIQSHLLRCVSQIASKMRKLEKIKEYKQEYVILLRQCFNPRFHHLCRTVSPELLCHAALVHDNNVNIRLQRIVPDLPLVAINTSVDQWPCSYKRARLPVRLGGLGILAASCMMHSAFVASLGFSWSFLGAYSAAFSNVVRPSLLQLAHSADLVPCAESR